MQQMERHDAQRSNPQTTLAHPLQGVHLVNLDLCLTRPVR